jgi:hypothetical protein
MSGHIFNRRILWDKVRHLSGGIDIQPLSVIIIFKHCLVFFPWFPTELSFDDAFSCRR